jgi:lysophospholipase L1-like esterase
MKRSILLLLFSCVFILFANGQKEKRSLQKLNLLTIGDSNGTFEYSWPQQLKHLLPNASIVNKSISGNTIGFDNLDRAELNTLKNINRYLEEAFKEIGPQNSFDYILINLGTNDTKRIFINQQNEVPKNMALLIQLIKQFIHDHQKQNPKICIITPSPMDESKVNIEKYGGGDLRIQKNNKQFKKVATYSKVGFIDTNTVLKNGFSEKTTDGVHLNEKAQLQLATQIVNYINKK